MKRPVLLSVFLSILLASCHDIEKEISVTSGCRTIQSNQVFFMYASNEGHLQAINDSANTYLFRYTSQGRLASIEDTRASTIYPVETDAAGNITQAVGYAFVYDDQNRLVQYQKLTGEIDSYRRFEYTDGNLNKVYIKTLPSFAMDGPPAIAEVLSEANFQFDINQTPWQGDKVLQWLVGTAILTPFQTADRASAYSQHNVTGYSIYYADNSSQPRFTSSVRYMYNASNTPISYVTTGSAGVYECLFGYNCGNSTSGDQ